MSARHRAITKAQVFGLRMHVPFAITVAEKATAGSTRAAGERSRDRPDFRPLSPCKDNFQSGAALVVIPLLSCKLASKPPMDTVQRARPCGRLQETGLDEDLPPCFYTAGGRQRGIRATIHDFDHSG